MNSIIRPALAAVLSLLVLFASSCSHVDGGQLERIERLGSWDEKETAYRDIVTGSDDRVLVSKAEFFLIEGYLERNKRSDAEACYDSLKSTARSVSDDIERTEILAVASKAAGLLAESYAKSMNYFKAAAYIEEEVSFLEGCGENISDELLVLIDLYTKACSYDNALSVFNKWSALYGEAFPELAEATGNRLIENMNIGEVGT